VLTITLRMHSCSGVTPSHSNNRRRKRHTQGNLLFYAGLQLGHKLAEREGSCPLFVRNFRSPFHTFTMVIMCVLDSLLSQLLYVPAPHPRFELGMTDSESAVLPVTPMGNETPWQLLEPASPFTFPGQKPKCILDYIPLVAYYESSRGRSRFSSAERESNPRRKLGRLSFYH
jgi:hypothetical protein